MIKLNADEIRESFLKFFESKAHLQLPSYSLVPVDDPTLLLIGAGMAPLKPYFRGEAKPPSPRVTTCQKCIRVGDIENVGQTARHHTFFEMLGNFSFGDYFKKETCSWGWEYLVDVLKIPPEKIYVTIHPEDDEAEDIWVNHVGFPREKIYRDPGNFWGPIGDTGPCGPCSELLVDQGPEFSCGSPDCKPGCDCDRYLEIWNLVFTGLNKNEKGEYEKLPKPCIDTGLGFERLVCYLHGKKNDFETELFMPYIDIISEITGVKLGDNTRSDVAIKVIADHCRALIFMACDGITPSNEGRGYVMRRLLRRSVRFAREINFTGSLTVLVEPVVKRMGYIYPELKEKQEYAASIIQAEEENFRKTLNQGMALLDNMLDKLEAGNEKIIPGTDVFSLYDTYGFPLELTGEIAQEKGFEIDRAGFEKALEEQRKRAKSAMEKKLGSLEEELDLSRFTSRFVGYETLGNDTEILGLFVKGKPVASINQNEEAGAVFAETCLYGESGGQVGDSGRFKSDKASGIIEDTRKTTAGVNLHIIKVKQGTISVGDRVSLQVTNDRRKAVMRHHSATHLLQGVLRQVLGTHVTQMGSLVEEDRLRFDFSHHSQMTREQIEEVENLVNKRIIKNVPVESQELPINEALKKGALAFFGEKYDDRVRVVSMGEFSTELCGGTHVGRTGDIGCLKITSESAIGMGTRRLEAVCGMSALHRFQKEENILREASSLLTVDFDGLTGAIARQREGIKGLEKELKALKEKALTSGVDDYLSRKESVEDVDYISVQLEGADRDGLRKTADLLGDKMKSGVIVLGAAGEGKASLVVKVTDDLVKKGLNAVSIIRGVAKIVDGGGGGRPNMAQAGGKEPARLNQALEHTRQVIKDEIDKMKVKK